ncbi:SLBB domain-containing protein [Gammaproteobacteria bacterium]|nr:SLBB domain-containing protein [Gammaproteobacteria bacterium]
MNRKITLFLILFISIPFIANAQVGNNPQSEEIDKDYLNSLPEEIRSDVLKEIDKGKEENKVTRRPSTKIATLQTIQEWERFKSENLIESERYGMNLFRSMQSSFMPINEPNFDSNYVLDFGDVLSIQLIGSENLIDKYEIGRDGSINFEQIGKIFIAGLSLDKASDMIKTKVTTSYIGTEAFVSLDNVRDIQIFITGGSRFPGIYTLNGNSHVLHALNVAGGITEEGSFRSIQIKRNGEVVNEVDLYQALILGDTSFNIPLKSGDTIYIKPALKLVRVSGALNNTGVFELKDNETFSDLIKYAGGFSRAALSNQRVILNRLEGGIYVSSSLAISDFEDQNVINGDSIYAKKQEIGTITINGEVQNPGKYSISNQDTISSVIKRAGGYTDNAYVFASSIFKKKLIEQEKLLNEELYNNFIKMIAYGSTNFMDPILFSNVLQEFKNIKSYGRAVAEFDLQVIDSDPSKDMLVDDGDEINVPKYNSNVLVYGQVNKPSSVQYVPGQKAKDYIKNVGGFNNLADKNSVIIIKPNGELLTDSNGLMMLSSDNVDVYPGSLIFVPNQVIYQDARIEFLGSVAPIFSSLALSIASLNSIN